MNEWYAVPTICVSDDDAKIKRRAPCVVCTFIENYKWEFKKNMYHKTDQIWIHAFTRTINAVIYETILKKKRKQQTTLCVYV